MTAQLETAQSVPLVPYADVLPQVVLRQLQQLAHIEDPLAPGAKSAMGRTILNIAYRLGWEYHAHEISYSSDDPRHFLSSFHPTQEQLIRGIIEGPEPIFGAAGYVTVFADRLPSLIAEDEIRRGDTAEPASLTLSMPSRLLRRPLSPAEVLSHAEACIQDAQALLAEVQQDRDPSRVGIPGIERYALSFGQSAEDVDPNAVARELGGGYVVRINGRSFVVTEYKGNLPTGEDIENFKSLIELGGIPRGYKGFVIID